MNGLVFPVKNGSLRKALAAKDNICPECGSELDTGWECNNNACRYDAQSDALACSNADVLTWLLIRHPLPPSGQRNRFGDVE